MAGSALKRARQEVRPAQHRSCLLTCPSPWGDSLLDPDCHPTDAPLGTSLSRAERVRNANPTPPLGKLELKTSQTTASSIQMCSLYSQAQTLSQQHEKLLYCKGTGKWVGRRKGNVGENETNLLSPLPCLWERGSQTCTGSQTKISS